MPLLTAGGQLPRVRRAYIHAAEYWPDMQAWANYLDELRDAGKVIPLRRENA